MGFKIFVGKHESQNTKARGLQFRAALTQGSGRQMEVARVQAARDL
jgi:hypothetical protein